ncbi:MAG: arylsulfatase [Pirellulaceae bacterium]
MTRYHQGFLCLLFAFLIHPAWLAADQPTNIILIMTDDQGIGDLGVMGNPVIETPHIDGLASQSTWLTNFYVHPVCAPTRACLMTGRYNYRTRAIDTYIGRAMMEPAEVTIAEVLGDHGYATGVFGKWHLGDCYPMRAIDQGFDQAVIHRGGGIGQPSDPLDARRQYTDPILMRNGQEEQFEGYCTDIYYDEAMKFIDRAGESGQPFFVYLPDNTPHGPFHDVPEDLYEHYREMNISREMFGKQSGHAFGDPDPDFLARVYAMIGNVDRNVGRLLDKLDRDGLADDTIVIFMCDNGPNSGRFVRGMRGNKSSVYEGGIRSPMFIRWPGQFTAGREVEQIAAHIDLMPTLLACAEALVPDDISLDGRNLLPLLRDEAVDWPDRHIVIQSHRGNQPTRYHHFALRNQRWKLLHHSGFGKERFEGEPRLELYDMSTDPLEQHNIAEQHPEVVDELKQAYDDWFDDVGSTRPDNYAPPRIVIDPEHENPLVLTRQDWRRSDQRGWGNRGYWLIETTEPVSIVVQCRLLDDNPADSVRLIISGQPTLDSPTDESKIMAEFRDVKLEPGQYEISTEATHGDEIVGAYQLFITSRSD